MKTFWDKLKDRSVPQRLGIFLASAWGALQVVEFFSQHYHWPGVILDILLVVLLGLIPFIFITQWFQSLDAKRLKNALLATNLMIILLISVFIGITRSEETRSIQEENLSSSSILVLPFKVFPDSVRDAYFANGITSAIIAQLTRLNSIPVFAENVSFRYKHHGTDLSQISAETKADFILQGQVQREGSSIRIRAQLVKTATGIQLWADNFSGSLQDVFKLEDEVSLQIAQSLKLKLDPATEKKINSQITANLKAYDYYLKGKFFGNSADNRGLDSATRYYLLAIKEDPQFAKAHAELSGVYSRKNQFNANTEANLFELAYTEAEKALNLDSTLAEVYYARAASLWNGRNKYPHVRAIRDYQKALALNPNYVNALTKLADVYVHLGLFEECKALFGKAVKLDPTNRFADAMLLGEPIFEFQYDKIVTDYHTKLPKSFLDIPVWHMELLVAMTFTGKEEAATADIKKLLEKNPKEPFTNAAFAVLLARKGNKIEALKHIQITEQVDNLVENSISLHHATYYLGVAYALLNEKEKAMQWLTWTREYGFPCYPVFSSDTELKNLRDYPPYQNLIANLKHDWEEYKKLPLK